MLHLSDLIYVMFESLVFITMPKICCAQKNNTYLDLCVVGDFV